MCEPCFQELIKCQECKNKEAQTITTKNNSDIILCEECYKKIEEQEKVVKELEAKVDKFLPASRPFNTGEETIMVRGCKVVVEALEKTDWTLEQMKELRDILNEVNEKGKGEQKFWSKVVKGFNPLGSLQILDKRIKAKEEEEAKPNPPREELPQKNPNQKEPIREQPNPQRENPNQELKICDKCGKNTSELITLSTRSSYNGKGICQECEKKLPDRKGEAFACVKCGKIGHWKTNFCQNCHDEEYRKKNSSIRNKYPCEGCGTSCIIRETETSYTIRRKRYIKHNVDFTSQASIWFGLNCSCIERFKQENQQTCHQCQKREFPKNWVLDYELKMAFCSPMCHVSYREAQWARENQTNQPNQARPNPAPRPNPTSWARSARLFPAELELSDAGKKEDFDWEKEALKKEVLTLKEMVKTLKTKPSAELTKSTKGSGSAELENYFLELCQNTQQQAEQVYESKYGKSELNDLLGSSQQPKKNYWPLIIGGGLAIGGLVIGLVVYFVGKKRT